MAETKFDSDKSEIIRKRLQAAQEAVEAQLKDETSDLEFQVPEKQWPADVRAAREGQPGSGSGSPPRPCLTVPQLDQPVDLVVNRMQQAHLGIGVHPISEEADDETAEVMQDLVRAIERDSNAANPRNWAFLRAVKCGRGFYRVNCVHDDDAAAPEALFDQKIVIQRILNQENVFIDPSCQEMDFSDMRYAFIVAWMSLKDYKDEYPDSEVAKGNFETAADFDKLLVTSETTPNWVDLEESKGVMVAEYWTREKTSEKWALWADKDGEHITKFSEIPEGVAAIRTRDKDVWKVRMERCGPGGQGIEILETVAWDGKYIPIIPVFGKELIPFDEQRRFKGIIRDAKDPVKMTNWAASNMAETVALEPRAPVMVAEGQLEGYERLWDTLNTVNHAYLTFRTKDIDGQPTAHIPGRLQSDTSKLTMSISLLEQAKSWVQASTQTPEAALGVVSPDRSGKAIERLQQQSAMSQDGYLQNFSNVSMPCEAKIVIDLIPHKYDRKARVARIIGADDKTRTVMLNAPFKMVPGKSLPQRVQETEQGMKRYDLNVGSYGVSVSIGQSYPTRKAEGAVELGELMKMSPEALILIAPEFFQFSDTPGAQQLSELFTKFRNFRFPFLAKKEDGEIPTPDELEAELEAYKAELQQAQQQLQQAAELLKTEGIKAEADLEKVKMQSETALAKAKIDAESRAGIEGSQAGVDKQIEALKAQTDIQLQRMKEAFDERILALTHAFEAKQAELDRDAEQKKAEFAAAQAHAMAGRQENQADKDREIAQDTGGDE